MPDMMINEVPLPMPRRYLLAEPHQEDRAAAQRDHGRGHEHEARLADHIAGAFQPDRDAVGLEGRQRHGQVARVLVHHLAARFALLLELLEGGRDRRHQLDDDGGRDVRHDVQGEDRHAVDAAAREHVEHAQDAARLGLEYLLPDVRIDAGQRDIGAEPIDQKRTHGEPDALLQLLGLGKRREIEIGCKLFRC
jgi:hypothetical protein